jgi:protein-disulfide isomerase
MRAFVITLAGAIGGAALSVAIVLTLAANGRLPINDRQMQTYLMLHPELASAMMGQQQALEENKQKLAAAAAVHAIGKAAFFDPKIAFLVGPADAKKSLVEFYDYNCPFCRASLPAVMKYVAAHRHDTRFSFIEFPIKGANSVIAARAALAARLQPEHYLPFHYALMSADGMVTEQIVFAQAAQAGLDVAKLKTDMANPEIDKSIEASLKLAHKAGIDGTPTFLVNGRMHPGALDDDTLAQEMKS